MLQGYYRTLRDVPGGIAGHYVALTLVVINRLQSLEQVSLRLHKRLTPALKVISILTVSTV